jgi:hypothetical protein
VELRTANPGLSVLLFLTPGGFPSQQPQVALQVVPEPAALALTAGGLLVLAGVARRRV